MKAGPTIIPPTLDYPGSAFCIKRSDRLWQASDESTSCLGCLRVNLKQCLGKNNMQMSMFMQKSSMWTLWKASKICWPNITLSPPVQVNMQGNATSVILWQALEKISAGKPRQLKVPLRVSEWVFFSWSTEINRTLLCAVKGQTTVSNHVAETLRNQVKMLWQLLSTQNCKPQFAIYYC